MCKFLVSASESVLPCAASEGKYEEVGAVADLYAPGPTKAGRYYFQGSQAYFEVSNQLQFDRRTRLLRKVMAPWLECGRTMLHD